jgi:hypothetical protein
LILAAASDSLEVLLQFAFLGVLYLFLLWVVTSALRDLRRPAPGVADELEAFPGEEPAGPERAWLVAQGGGGIEAGESFEVGRGLTIGRSGDSAIKIDDSFASGRHARVQLRGGMAQLEDLRSTNGTYLNGQRVEGEIDLRPGDVIRIGDAEFRYEE